MRASEGRRAVGYAAWPVALLTLLLSSPAPAASAPASKTKPETAKPTPIVDATDEASAVLRKRIVALALKQVQFGSVSLLPVRFEKSRLAGPFEDGGRTLYCVSSHMKGRTFGKPERPKVVMQEDKGTLTVLDEDEVCEEHRTKPFTEMDSAAE